MVSDNVGGARVAVEHLIARGHREIAIVGSRPNSFPSILQRRRGYEQAISKAGLVPHFVDVAHVPPEASAPVALEYIARAPRGSTAAFCCCNDDVAVALIQAAQAAGYRCPGRPVGGRTTTSTSARFE